MFQCICGGVLIVKHVEEYPTGLSAKEKIDYIRTCTTECPDCNKVFDGQKFD